MNQKKNTNPVLITGSHRSGSTWAGNMIGFSPSLSYLHEPFFNINRYNPGIFNFKFDFWYFYLCEANGDKYKEYINDTLSYKYNTYQGLSNIKSINSFNRFVQDYLRFKKLSFFKRRPLVKDPMALFSAEWLAKEFKMDVVVLVRNPVAFVGSIVKKNWFFPFDHLIKQPMLMDDYLYPFRDTIESYSKNKWDIIDNAILIWNITHYMIANYMKSNNGWIFLKHEDLSSDPLQKFREVYDKLELKYTDSVEKNIKKYCFNKKKDSDLSRDSKINIHEYKNRLNDETIKKIRKKTEEISSIFYSDKYYN